MRYDRIIEIPSGMFYVSERIPYGKWWMSRIGAAG